jgi:GNAT superfamily N-acetyltransferase
MPLGSQIPDAASVWRLYARHAELVYAGGRGPTLYLTERAFFAASGEQHVDLNQAGLFGGATEADAELLVERILAAEVPCLFGHSSGAAEGIGAIIAGAGFVRMPKPEQLFWMRGTLEALLSAPFEVRRVQTATDIAAMQAIFLEAHGYEAELTDALNGRRMAADDGMTGWLAWDGDEPVSFAIVSQVGASLGLWEVMTPARHRRRGAARAVVAAALDGVARASTELIEQTLFWSSPAGRPLYESMGFTVVDTVDAWALGASEADLIAVGAG